MKAAKRKAAASRPEVEDWLARADPSLGRVIAAVKSRIGVQRIAQSHVSPFEALVRAVVYQSVSGKAAASIFGRLRELTTKPITPRKILSIRPRALTKAGLSGARVRAVRGLATWFEANRKLSRKLSSLPDAEIVALLKAIPGIGTWTVNVLLIFNFARLDVMPAADFGIRRGIQLMDGLRTMATPTQVIERAQIWAPYRSIASIYLWQAMRLKLDPKDIN
jgi:DNA-3-methyladenine glycosylase II